MFYQISPGNFKIIFKHKNVFCDVTFFAAKTRRHGVTQKDLKTSNNPMFPTNRKHPVYLGSDNFPQILLSS